MSVLSHPEFDAHEQVSFCCDRASGLRAIIAIHRSGELGIAGGGCRMWPYRSDDEALRDVLRLSRAMTYKLALADLPAGGAKCVVIGDSRADKSDELWRALGRAVDGLGGRFVIAEDVGTTPADMDAIARETPYVAGRIRGGGDTADATARGACAAIERAVQHQLGRSRLEGVRVAIQGLGAVGWHLANRLRDRGATLVVADLRADRCRRARDTLGADVVSPDDLTVAECDVLSPCALGDVLDETTVPRLRCKIIAGPANNQLATANVAYLVAERGILYAPDFVVNMGGVLGAALAFATERRLERALQRIPSLLSRIFAEADERGISTHDAAVALAARTLGAQAPPRSHRLLHHLWSRPWAARAALRTRGHLVGPR